MPFYVTQTEFHQSLSSLHGHLFKVYEAFDNLDQRLEKQMADLQTALTDLDGLLSDVEAEVAALKQQVATEGNTATQAAADSIEQKIAAARQALQGVTGGTGGTPTDPGTPTTTDPGNPGTGDGSTPPVQ